ncbi:hypothetical protein PEX2_035950 [Penicillium expansum]|uniref:F-box domain-containing protein n=1 Tax=Penicillium expansum TaxID=27334 RepID=A0A0A2JZM2_PENEN|nr:hypothetical protein PEX2_035950 [Penicillium expansum]KGO60088.1 hypothetical protein PEX2_035950 [Penicillium expansum]
MPEASTLYYTNITVQSHDAYSHSETPRLTVLLSSVVLAQHLIPVWMSIATLPTELVCDICRYLELHDWIAFRTTCQAVYTKSLDAFADRYCKSIGLILTSHSLRRLEELATNDSLRTRVQELWVVPSLFGGFYEMDVDSFRSCTASHKDRPPKTATQINAQHIAYQILVVDHLSIIESDTLNNVLKECMARFENLTAIRMQLKDSDFFWSSNPIIKDDVQFLGWRGVKRQLGFDPFGLNARKPIHNLWKSRAKDHAIAFTALLEASVASNRKLKKLDICNDDHCALPPSDVTLKLTHKSLLSCLGGLEYLHLCICVWEAQSDDSALRYLIDIPITVAPSLKVLTFSQWDRNGAMSPRYFIDLSQRINFTQLVKLNLYWIEITYDTFKVFLRTAMPTLRILALQSLNLRGAAPMDTDSGHNLLKWDSPEINEESSAAWRQVWDFLGDGFSLRSLSLQHLGYRGHRLHLRDDLSSLSGSSEPNGPIIVAFDAERAGVSFKEWVTQLQTGPPRGPRIRYDSLPGKDYTAHMV